MTVHPEKAEYHCDYCKKPMNDTDLQESVYWWDEADNHLACKECAKRRNLAPGFQGGLREKF